LQLPFGLAVAIDRGEVFDVDGPIIGVVLWALRRFQVGDRDDVVNRLMRRDLQPVCSPFAKHLRDLKGSNALWAQLGSSAKGSFGLPNMLSRGPNCMDASANSIAETGVFYNRHISRIS
jgi:hypothetical protein